MPPRSSSAAGTRGRGTRPVPVLGTRALNRALLERQFLLRRSKLPVTQLLEHLAGLQAQATHPPYFGLWTRLERFQHEELTALLNSRRVVRIAMMRSTLHLVTAEDCLVLRPLLQPALDRLFGHSAHLRRLKGLDLQALVAAAREVMAVRPCTLAELGRQLQARWPDREASAMAAAVRTLEPLVMVPPWGTWGHGGQSVYTRAESWLGRPPGPAASVDALVLRYLAAFGPATVKDLQVWSGLVRLRETLERLRPRLRTFRDEHGGELFDLPDAPRPDPDIPAPPRFLPEFDNVLLSYEDRTRIIADAWRSRVFTINGLIRATVLVDGFVRGIWKVERKGGSATLHIEPFERLSKQDRTALEEEGARLLTFAVADARDRDVRFARPG